MRVVDIPWGYGTMHAYAARCERIESSPRTRLVLVMRGEMRVGIGADVRVVRAGQAFLIDADEAVDWQPLSDVSTVHVELWDGADLPRSWLEGGEPNLQV